MVACSTQPGIVVQRKRCLSKRLEDRFIICWQHGSIGIEVESSAMCWTEELEQWTGIVVRSGSLEGIGAECRKGWHSKSP
jgi:hypothetical protein